jgi:hypothetical protein
MNKHKIIGFSVVIFMLVSTAGGFALAVQGASELTSYDVLNYPTVSLLLEGNYTVASTSVMKTDWKADNFLGMSSEGDPVFSFSSVIKSITDDTEEFTLAENWDMYAIPNRNYFVQAMFASDQSNLVENGTDIESGETFFYGTEFTSASYPFLWVSGIHSPIVGTNTTITVKDGATSVTLLNTWITKQSEFWFDLTASASACTTPDNITISNAAIDGSVRIFNVGGSRELKDGRHITNYVGGQLYDGSATQSAVYGAGSIDAIVSQGVSKIVNLPTQLKPPGQQRVRHRITGWGSRAELEDALLEAIAQLQGILADDIQSYKLASAEIVNTISPPVHEVCKTFAVDIAGKTSTLQDFTEGLEDTSISGSVIVADNPADKPNSVFSSAWSWIKENAEKLIDNTKSAIASIVHGKSSGEWGADMTAEITDANGQIDRSPTVLNSLSEKLFEVMNFMQRNWYWFAAAGLLIGIIVTIVIIRKE